MLTTKDFRQKLYQLKRAFSFRNTNTKYTYSHDGMLLK